MAQLPITLKQLVDLQCDDFVYAHLHVGTRLLLRYSSALACYDSRQMAVVWKQDFKSDKLGSLKLILHENGLAITTVNPDRHTLEVRAFGFDVGNLVWTQSLPLKLASNGHGYAQAAGCIYLFGADADGQFQTYVLQAHNGAILRQHAGKAPHNLFSLDGAIFAAGVDGIFEWVGEGYSCRDTTEVFAIHVEDRACYMIAMPKAQGGVHLMEWHPSRGFAEICPLPDTGIHNWIIGAVGDGTLWIRNDDKPHTMWIDLRLKPPVAHILDLPGTVGMTTIDGHYIAWGVDQASGEDELWEYVPSHDGQLLRMGPNKSDACIGIGDQLLFHGIWGNSVWTLEVTPT